MGFPNDGHDQTMTTTRPNFWFKLAATGMAVWVGFFMLQDQLLYFPDKASVAELASDRLHAWPPAEDFRGLVAEPAGTVRGTVVVFHGNAGHAGHREFYATRLAPLGFRVILAEYPGYGPRDGEPGERPLVKDAEQTIARASQLYGAPLLLIGESLGAAVAAAAGARHSDRITGLLLITPWDQLANVASHHYPFLPVSMFLHDRYNSVFHLASFRRPVVVAVAEKDDIVPPRFGQALFESLPGPKLLKIMPDAGHNDWILTVDREWWREVVRFLLDGTVAE